MRELFVLRRANGDLYTEQAGEELRVPVWSSRESVERYRERNPALRVFFPARLERRLLTKALGGNGARRDAAPFLLSEDSPDASLSDGRTVGIDELLPAVGDSIETATAAAV